MLIGAVNRVQKRKAVTAMPQMKFAPESQARRARPMKFPLMNAFSAVLFACTVAATFAAPTHAALARYLNPSEIDLVRILAPPPTPHSPEATAELEAVLTAQRARTDADVKRAQADDELSVFRYADVMGTGFAPEDLPFATAFFKEVAAEGGQVVNPTR
jgi:hypothetical protein